jgi:hypothetical protein
MAHSLIDGIEIASEQNEEISARWINRLSNAYPGSFILQADAQLQDKQMPSSSEAIVADGQAINLHHRSDRNDL